MLDGDVVRPVQQRSNGLYTFQVIERKDDGPVGLRDRFDTPSRHRASHETHGRCTARRIGSEAPAPDQQRRILDAAETTADPAHSAIACSRARRVVARTRSLRYGASAWMSSIG